MPFNLITNDSKINQAEQFVESFSETDNTKYYMFFGHHTPYPGGFVPEIENSRQDISIDVYSNMIFAKRILPADVNISVPRVDWVTNVVYSAYDHRNSKLDTEQFYVGVQEGSNYNVFKCLFNNLGARSTVAPSFAAFSLVEGSDTETYDGYYETSDGYQWKYMFTVSDSNMSKFATNRYIPVTANSVVSAFAVEGAIDVVVVENAGSGYNNYFSGEFTANSDISYLGNIRAFALRTFNNVSPASTNGFYTGCVMKITEGAGAGQFREVTDYVNSGNARYVLLNESFTVAPDTTSKFEINPKVTVDGGHLLPAVGRAIISTGNSVGSVEMLDRGKGYFKAEAYIVQSNTAIASNTAILTPIISPFGGHGYNAKAELGASWVTMSVKVAGNENGVIPSGQKFGQVGILKDPRFSNVELTTVKSSNTATPGRDGSFIEGETITVFAPIQQLSTLTVTTGNNLVIVNSPNTMPANTLHFPDGRAYIQAPNSAWFASNVASSNSTTLTLEEPVAFTSNAATLHISYSNTHGIHLFSTSTTTNVTNANSFFVRGNYIIGLQTFTVAVITDIQNNNKLVNGFTVLNQLSIISTEEPTSAFVADDFISNVSNTVSCSVHSYANAGHIYVTNIKGDLVPGTVLRNISGDASVTVADKYNGQIVQESGSILYLENHELVNRATSTAQTKKIIVEF